MTLKATEVFTPGSFPALTYVERSGDRLERSLRDAIDTPGQVVSLVGPSKSGKTVLVERVIGRESLITVTGARIGSPEDIWTRVLDWMGAPNTRGSAASTSGRVGIEAGASGSTGIPGLAKVSGDAKGNAEVAHEREKSTTFERAGLQQVVKDIANSDYVVLVHAFHYMPRRIQSEAAKSPKEAVRLGIKVCTASVRHRGDDLVRANPELRGRVRAIDIEYWNDQDLQKIAASGFSALDVTLDAATIQKLVLEAAGSPQLMQLLCLNACFFLNIRQKSSSASKISVGTEQLRAIFEQTSANTDFRSLVDVLDAGPKTRGTERMLYDFADGSRGDVYRAVLKAVASDPPRLSFSYEELLKRMRVVCKDAQPAGSSIVGTCHHISKLALEKFPNERAVDWDEQKQILDIPDPYLLFYLRWSGRLSEGE